LINIKTLSSKFAGLSYTGGIDPKCKRASAAEKGENGLHHEVKVF